MNFESTSIEALSSIFKSCVIVLFPTVYDALNLLNIDENNNFFIKENY